jgi:predicted P-loop ATPase/GTPase
LTATEIVPAGIRLGYPAAGLTGYAELIRAGDERRYRPDPIARDVCRVQMARTLALISQDRCDEVITPVAAPLRRAAEQAWVQLQHCYGPAVATGSSDPASAGPTGGAR